MEGLDGAGFLDTLLVGFAPCHKVAFFRWLTPISVLQSACPTTFVSFPSDIRRNGLHRYHRVVAVRERFDPSVSVATGGRGARG